MKKILAITVLAVLSLSSCTKRYTCPTYLQNNEPVEDVRVKQDQQELNKTKDQTLSETQG